MTAEWQAIADLDAPELVEKNILSVVDDVRAK